jgi:4-amino-4-deoxy-L-arabinose transferase-like glycosyltransferase
MLTATAWFARRRLGGHAALYAPLILASSPIFVALARTLLFDGLFTGLLAWSLALAHEALVGAKGRALLRAAYAVLALAVLTKGLAAIVFFAGILVVAIVLTRDGRRVARLRMLLDPWALAIFAALAVPWHVAAWVREPSFGWFYLWNEHVGRFVNARWPRDYHTGPVWYYLPRVAGYAFPWILLLLVPQRREEDRDAPLQGFVWAWLLVPLAIFSIAGSKADYYMVVGFPPLALLLARRLDRARPSRALALLPLAILALAAAAMVLLRQQPQAVLPPHAGMLLAASVAVMVAACVAFGLRNVRAGAVALSALGIVVALAYSSFLEANEATRSARSLARAIRDLRPAGVYVYRDFERVSALPFYLQQPVGVVDSRSRDLLFGMRLHPDAGRFPAPRAFLASASRGGPLVLVVRDDRSRAFAASPLAARFERVGRIGHFELYRYPPLGHLVAVSRPADGAHARR